jgi:hypothetical protein
MKNLYWFMVTNIFNSAFPLREQFPKQGKARAAQNTASLPVSKRPCDGLRA